MTRGFSQVNGVDYIEVYSPVVKHETLRLVLAIVAEREMHLHQIDIKTAFIRSDLSEEIYLTPPELPTELHEKYQVKHWHGKAWRLLKAIYGLKQGARSWHITLSGALVELGFVASSFDPSLFYHNSNGMTILILIYVDDILIASKSMSAIEKFKRDVGRLFEIRDLGKASLFLGISILHSLEENCVYMHQASYIRQLLQRFGLTNCTPISTPMRVDTFQLVSQADGKRNNCSDLFPYRELVGALLYLSTVSRPDISFSVSVLARSMHAYSEVHWMAAKNVLRYLKGTLGYAICYDGCTSIAGFTDSDWAGDIYTRKSTNGYIFKAGNAAVSWKSKLQSVVAHSTLEAEYIAQAFATKEALWLRGIGAELGIFNPEKPLPIFSDNLGAISLSKEGIVTHRTKHIGVAFHVTRDYIHKGLISLSHISSPKMPADMLTKPVDANRLSKNKVYVGLRSLQDDE